MKEIIENTLLAIYLLAIMCSVIAAIKYRQFLKGRKLQIFLPFLLYIFIQELFLTIYRKLMPASETTETYKLVNTVYNIYKPLSVIVTGWMYASIPFLQRHRKVFFTLVGLYVLSTIFLLFFSSWYSSNPYLTFVRAFIITIFGIFFLYRYFLLDNLSKELYWRPVLWVTIGLVIFYPVTSIAFTFQKYLYEYDATLYGLKLYQLIPQLMSIFMYSCFSYAFYLCRKTN